VNSFPDNIGETPADVDPVDLGPGRTATAITGGALHNCAILDNGEVRCWGDGDDGKLGYGNQDVIGDDETPGSVGPVDLGPGRTATAIAAGFDHTCAILDDDTVRCWGEDGLGQLGQANTDDITKDNNIGDDETPGSVSPVDIGGPATALTAASWHTCVVLEGGRVRCWGLGTSGQLGLANFINDGVIGDDEVPSSVGPVALGGIVGGWVAVPAP
jgi:alpha-tubulin suppressor-like RCC1 family protein